LLWCVGRLLSLAALDDLVEFAAIEPNAAALRAVIHFNALAFGRHQGAFLADGTFHDCIFLL
jgi:hypothetical protein